jgi:hypothetical protein
MPIYSSTHPTAPAYRTNWAAASPRQPSACARCQVSARTPLLLWPASHSTTPLLLWMAMWCGC